MFIGHAMMLHIILTLNFLIVAMPTITGLE